MKKLSILVAVVGMSISASHAADNGFYFGGGLTHSSLDFCDSSTESGSNFFLVDDESCSNTGGQVVAGYQFTNNFAVELGYDQTSEFNEKITETFRQGGITQAVINADGSQFALVDGPVTLVEGSRIKTESIALKAVGRISAGNRVSLLGTFGIHRGEITVKETHDYSEQNGVRVSGNKQQGGSVSGTDILYGLGVEIALTEKLSTRVSWTRYEYDDVASGLGGDFDEIDAYGLLVIYRN